MREAIVIAVLITAGCVAGEAADMLTLKSGAFADGGEIPEKYGYKRDNVSPPLEISSVPADARSLVLIMDDPDAQRVAGRVWVHWVVWNMPAETRAIEEGESPGIEGKTDFGTVGYGGPAPPDRPHVYVFKLYALDAMLDLPEGSTKEQVEAAMRGHVIAQTQLKGRYAP